jgi:hypothetical protein
VETKTGRGNDFENADGSIRANRGSDSNAIDENGRQDGKRDE